MSISDDKNLKSFLKLNEPQPPVQTEAEANAVMLAIEQEIASSHFTVMISDSKPNVGRTNYWFGAGSFIAATLIAAVVSLKTVSVSHMESPTLVSSADVIGFQLEAQDPEDESPALEIGQDWLDLVAAY